MLVPVAYRLIELSTRVSLQEMGEGLQVESGEGLQQAVM